MKVPTLAPWCLFGVLSWIGSPAPAGERVVHADTWMVDAATVERGLRARVGERLTGWEVDVSAAETEGGLDVRLVRPDGTRESREMSVGGETVDDRSRELAAAVALLVDQYRAKAKPGAPVAPVRRFFVGIGPKIGMGRPSDVDVGGSVVAGAWLAKDHLMPRLQASWSGAWDGTLVVHGARFGPGLAAGAAVADGRVWLGGFAVPQALWVQARDVVVVDRWISSSEVGGLVQLRFERIVIGVRTGVDVALPPLRARGQDGTIRWGTFRYMVGLTAGPRF